MLAGRNQRLCCETLNIETSVNRLLSLDWWVLPREAARRTLASEVPKGSAWLGVRSPGAAVNSVFFGPQAPALRRGPGIFTRRAERRGGEDRERAGAQSDEAARGWAPYLSEVPLASDVSHVTSTFLTKRTGFLRAGQMPPQVQRHIVDRTFSSSAHCFLGRSSAVQQAKLPKRHGAVKPRESSSAGCQARNMQTSGQSSQSSWAPVVLPWACRRLAGIRSKSATPAMQSIE